LIDLHSHILPGVDDGPPALSGSLELARAAVAAGTNTMVATPHVGVPHGVDPAVVGPATAALGQELRRAAISLQVLTGAEIAADRAVELHDEVLAGLGLGGTRWLLIEPPFAGPVALEPVLGELRDRGFGVVLAHPERCSGLRLDPAQLERLLGMGAVTSITASSLSGRFGRPVQDFALALLERGWVHNVASDAHDAVQRPPGVDDGFKAAGKVLHGIHRVRPYLVEALPAALLAGRPLPPPPAPPARRTRWRWRMLRR
jgi:protein-tyrosine phosphatase